MANLLHAALDSELRRQRALVPRPSMPVTGVPTGFRDLDCVTRGFQPGEVTLLLGENDVGKTTLLLNIAANAAIEHRVPTAFLTSRNAVYRGARTLLAGKARLRHHALAIGDVPDLEVVDAALKEIRDAPLLIQPANQGDLSDQLGFIYEQLGGEGAVRLLIVDGLKAESADGYMLEQRLMAALKEIAPKYAVTALMPVTLGSVGPGFPPMVPANPGLDALLGEADVVLALERDELKDPEGTPRPGEADLSVLKHPVAKPRIIRLAFLEDYPRFVTIARS